MGASGTTDLLQSLGQYCQGTNGNHILLSDPVAGKSSALVRDFERGVGLKAEPYAPMNLDNCVRDMCMSVEYKFEIAIPTALQDITYSL